MKIDSIGNASGKDSLTAKTPTARAGAALSYAHLLGLPGRVTEAAKTAPGKLHAVAAKLTRKTATSPASAPRAATPTLSAVAPTDTARIKQAIAVERARAAEILAAGIESGQVNQACALAFDTDVTAVEALAALNAGTLDTAARAVEGRYIRMGLNPTQSTGDARNNLSVKELAARIIAAGERARR